MRISVKNSVIKFSKVIMQQRIFSVFHFWPIIFILRPSSPLNVVQQGTGMVVICHTILVSTVLICKIIRNEKYEWIKWKYSSTQTAQIQLHDCQRSTLFQRHLVAWCFCEPPLLFSAFITPGSTLHRFTYLKLQLCTCTHYWWVIKQGHNFLIVIIHFHGFLQITKTIWQLYIIHLAFGPLPLG